MAAVVCVATTADAHVPRSGKGTVTQIIFGPRKIRITVDLGYDANWSRPEMVRMDRDGDGNGKASAEEAERYAELQWEKRVLPGLALKLDNVTIEFRKVGQRYEGPLGKPRSTPISFYYDIEVDVIDVKPPAVDAVEGAGTPTKDTSTVDQGHTLELETLAFRDPIRYPPLFVVPFAGHAPGADPGLALEPKFTAPDNVRLEPFGYVLEGPRLIVQYRFRIGTAALPPGVRPPAAEVAPPRTRLERAVDELTESTAEAWIRLLGLAFLWGVGWAVSPTHGRILVALLVVGAERRLREAFVLGLLAAAIHVGATFLLGWVHAGLASAEGGIPYPGAVLATASEAVSGAVMVWLGTWLFLRHWRGGPPAWQSRRGEWVLLAVSAGLPVAASSLPAAAAGFDAPETLAVTASLTVAFALGLGTALTVFTAFLLTGRPLVLGNQDVHENGAAKWLAVIAGLFVAALGAFYIARAWGQMTALLEAL